VNANVDHDHEIVVVVITGEKKLKVFFFDFTLGNFSRILNHCLSDISSESFQRKNLFAEKLLHFYLIASLFLPNSNWGPLKIKAKTRLKIS
jgi:hypothetical protein